MFKPKFKPLSDHQILELQELCQTPKLETRSKIVLFRNLGYEPKEIAMQLHCHIQTVWKALRWWNRDNFVSLLKKKQYQNTPEVLYWNNQIIDLVQTPPRALKLPFSTWSIQRLWKYVRDQGCPFGRERVRRVIKKADYRYRKTKIRPYAVHPDHALRKQEVFKNYNDTDPDHLVLVLDQKIFLTSVGFKGYEWGLEPPSIPSYQWHKGKAFMLGVYDVKADKM